ncbi:aldo/keto reductase [Salisediminibacterium halotolerans]|uniref:Predicted oxidoreductase n=1 Tax=Salisediminibacterium halotolerans TaxID=517425 RepID=A0A1H9TIR9_9BACI|nr:aldo/keto reductase [Salisediminibacterium haloalkalitolerans]SER97240.1 Predicted oxidoreductase [Salisediminibacterium haloalkalitolerans]
MNYRKLGSTDLTISELSFGTWAIGGAWGSTNDTEALKGLETAIDKGVNFFDTADVYGDGHAEKLIGRKAKERQEEVYIASKFGRGLDFTDPDTYKEKQVRSFLDRTLKNIGRDTLDLYQIHCPPMKIIQDGEIFSVLDKLQKEGKIRYSGVSVESTEEGLEALKYPNVKALQVIFNLFRQKPVDELFPKAIDQGVGILARVPLASGLLTGKFQPSQAFAADDHRNFNRDGAAFNVGETFAGLPFETGVDLSQEIEWIKDNRETMAAAALKWILEHDAISAVIPGFKTAKQVEDNLKAIDVPGFSQTEMEQLKSFYDERVHAHIRGSY